MRLGLETILPAERDAVLVRTRLVLTTPALRSRNWHNQDATRDLFAAALARRAAMPEPDLTTTVLAAAALAALTTAITTWADGDGAADLVELVDQAFSALGA